jgi:hypothetical protein
MTPSDSTQSPSSSPENALFTGQIQGLVATFFQNERPPRGLAGRLDWHFQGAISRHIQAGAISGKLGECVYLPLKHRQSTFHLILLGCGEAHSQGARGSVNKKHLEMLKKNLLSLKWKSAGISRSDFGSPSDDFLIQSLEGVSLWIGT